MWQVNNIKEDFRIEILKYKNTAHRYLFVEYYHEKIVLHLLSL